MKTPCIFIVTLVLGLASQVQAQDHIYPTAIVSTQSGRTITLESVSFRSSCDDPHYYRYISQEIEWVIYEKRVSIPELKENTNSVYLYKGHKPISFKKITFKDNGRVDKIEFINSETLDSAKVDISLLGQDWSISCPQLSGTYHDNGEAKNVTITVDKIIEKVRNAVSEDTKAQRAAVMAPKRLDKVQSDLIAIMREGVDRRKIDKGSAYVIIKTLNLPMTSAFVKDLKAVRDQFNQGKDYDELAGSLKVFAEQFEAESESKDDEGPEAKSYSPEDLELVCYMTLS